MPCATPRIAFACAGINTLMKSVCLLCVISNDFTPTIEASVRKVFTTTVVIFYNNVSQAHGAAFNDTIFTDAANSYYTGAFSESLPVAISLNTREIRSNTSTEISYQVNYDISYSYTQLITIAATDSVVQSSIGNVSTVKNGFEGTSSFSDLYTMSGDLSNFTFTGNRICPSVSCGSTHVFCNESDFGLSAICRSNCFNQVICQNGASCEQESVNRSPSCNCIGSGSVWYIGQYCEFKVEVWMIAVFLVLYLLVVAIIVAIGCWCWKRAGKSRRENTLKMEQRKTSPLLTQTRADISQNNRRGRNNKTLVRNTQLGTDPLPRIPEETHGVKPQRSPSVDLTNDQPSEMSRNSRRMSQSSSESGEETLGSMSYDSTANDVEIAPRSYETTGSSGNKSTQTNTQINLQVSDYVLAKTIS